jgi:Na+-exporting ATPase
VSDGLCTVTGDHISTATAIAREINIIKADENPAELAMAAAEFDFMGDEHVDELIELPRVVGRCSPDTKVKMIEALHRRKRIVAMTGLCSLCMVWVWI